MPQPTAWPLALQSHERRGQRQERHDDPGRRGEEVRAHRSARGAAVADDVEQLDRQHRQHAGHQVEDEPAEQRQRQHAEQPERARGGGTLCYGQRALGGALAVDQGQGDALSDQRVARHGSDRNAQHRLPAAVAERRHRLAEAPAVGAFDEQVRGRERRQRARRHGKLRCRTAVERGLLHRDTGAVARHARHEAVDQMGVRAGRGRAGRQGDGELRLVGNADLFADQVVELRGEAQRSARLAPASRRSAARPRRHSRTYRARTVRSAAAPASGSSRPIDSRSRSSRCAADIRRRPASASRFSSRASAGTAGRSAAFPPSP